MKYNPKPVLCASCGQTIHFQQVRGVSVNERGQLLQLCPCGALLRFKETK